MAEPTLQENAANKLAREQWLKRTDTLQFRNEVARGYSDSLDAYVSAAATPGTDLEKLVRLGTRCHTIKEILEKLRV